jgi:hypothetical protein
MNFHRSERYAMVLNVMLVGVMAYVAVLCVNDLVAASASSAAAPLSIATSPPEAVHGSRPRAAYDQIVQRDIFNLTPPPQVAVAPTAPDLHIRLLGTSSLSAGEPFAIVEDRETSQQLLFRVGETIPDTGRLVEVKHSSVTIDRGGGQLVTVAIESTDSTPATSEPNPPSTRSSRLSREDRGFIQR